MYLKEKNVSVTVRHLAKGFEAIVSQGEGSRQVSMSTYSPDCSSYCLERFVKEVMEAVEIVSTHTSS